MASTDPQVQEAVRNQQEAPLPPYSPPPPQNQVPRPEMAYSPHPQPAYSQDPNYAVPLERLRDEPETVDCPFCHQRTRTRVQKEDSGMTMLAGGLLCLVCICLACLPCMLGWAQHVDHYCMKCGKQLTHKPHDDMTRPVPAAEQAIRTQQSAGQPSHFNNAPPQQFQPMYEVQPAQPVVQNQGQHGVYDIPPPK